MSLPPVIDLGENSPIIIDNGSGWMKAGYSCDDRPRHIFPTLVARQKKDEESKKRTDKAEKNYYVGEDAKVRRKNMPMIIQKPVEKGVIVNWDDMVVVWHYIFTSLLHTPSETHPVLLTEAARNPPKEREKMTEIMFETFRVPSLYSQAKEVLALYTSGQTTGVVVDCGEAATTTVPIYEGYKISSSIKTLDIAGKKLTDFFARLLSERDIASSTTEAHEDALSDPPFPKLNQRDCIRNAKEKFCFVAIDFEQQITSNATPSGGTSSAVRSFKLPDGHEFHIDSECFRCPEALFQPQLLGLELNGIHESCYNSIMRCDTDIRRELYGNVVLSGGTTMFAGMSDRMSKELMALAPTAMKIKIVAPAERKNATWIGGSIFAALALKFSDAGGPGVWISKEEYEDVGPSIIHKKCF